MVDQFMMPQFGVNRCEFNIREIDAVNILVSGASVADQIAPAYWEVDLGTVAMQRGTSRYMAWTAFFDSLRGSKKIALLWDAEAAYPQAYGASVLGLSRAGGGGFDGTADIDVRTSVREFQIGDLPPNYVFSPGDYVSFVKQDRYWLTRVTVEEEGNALGLADIKVTPDVPTFFDTTAKINVVRPLGEFIMMPNTLSRPRTVGEGGPFSANFRSRVY
jgi:hypothetical protein